MEKNNEGDEMIEVVLIMFLPVLFWIGNSLANIAIGIKRLENRVRDLK